MLSQHYAAVFILYFLPNGNLLSFSRLKILIDFIPIDYVEKCIDVFGSAILVFQIIGMFPDIDSEDRRFALADRIVLVRCGHDLQFIVAPGQT
jgi:hypothetical protein